MDEHEKIDEVKIWIFNHPKIVAAGMLVTAGIGGYVVGRKWTTFGFNRFMTNFEDTIQRSIDEWGEANIKVTKQGYVWVIKNSDK